MEEDLYQSAGRLIKDIKETANKTIYPYKEDWERLTIISNKIEELDKVVDGLADKAWKYDELSK